MKNYLIIILDIIHIDLLFYVLVDFIARMIPGVLSKEESVMEESIYSGLLEYPQYTQPRSYEGMEGTRCLFQVDGAPI